MSEFVLPDRVAIIEFEDGDFAGAEVRARLRVSLGMLREVMVTLEQLEAGDDDPMAALGTLGDIFCARGLVSWNLVDADGPLPPDRDGWDRLDAKEAAAIISGWISGIARPPDPLPEPSSATGPSLAGSRSGRRASRSSQPSQPGSSGPSSATP